ncbi:lysine N(6)-hydroxylase/L-ornithine N(5)-oxygenase family protein [Achromobacter xylosoxidans]|uniref:lysine N(6)-hydroxylase/L-ornithine N(5)-oxygenase family protein n=1 Tax=Alcaligenes xylosoxydans xylosoxydans TaxID=85698 RepID=UPI001F13AD4A|nr:lysine N(6)-hydroxylase/L-ornithine N(5)-oxygenase family protein [Achromobacter xylosoxidans]
MHIHDLIGIGFGPSNVALAIALEEQAQTGGREVDALFIERQAAFAWHPHMLLDHAHMQISFLKDLATQRNPASRYTFLNYLHEKNRLQDFINLKTFFPSRHEFNDYLSWAASHFSEQVAYGEDVIEVLPELQNGRVTLLRVRARGADGRISERRTRALVVSVGGTANVPDAFLPFADDARVFHSSRYLDAMRGHGDASRVAVIGAGQSAAEIFLDLHNRGGVAVDLITRARAIKPSDDSPFVNEIFNPEYTDYIYNHGKRERAALIQEFLNTNYAAPDLDLIQDIYQVLYRQKVTGEHKHRFLRRNEVRHVRATEQGITLTLDDLDRGTTDTACYQAIVLATGYQRVTHQRLLASMSDYLGDFSVDRDYRVQAGADFLPAIYLQGCCEPSHGLSDTLLSITSVRTAEISHALAAALSRPSHDSLRGAAALAAH